MSKKSIFDVQFSEGGCSTGGATSSCSSLLIGSQLSTPTMEVAAQESTNAPVEEMSVLVANELNKLSFSEREVVYEDLHGVSRPDKEPKAIIDKSIVDTRKEISTIRVKPAYNKAFFLNPEYAGGDDFILMFLRSCKFNPKQTAKKIVDHFKYKLELFGYDNLGRDLRYEDLDEGTKNAIASGAVQVLPQRDSAGRAIVFFAFDALNYDKVDSQLRAIWYIMMCKLQDQAIQRHGTVQISYNVEYSDKSLHLDLLMKSSMIAKAMPQRILGVHFCYNNEVVKPVLSMLQMIVGTSARLRFRSHFGSFVEVKYSMQNFGIPHDTLPTDMNGKMDCSKIQAFVQEQIQVDEKRKKEQTGRIMHPCSKDVLMGRGWHQQEHPGNLELARIVEENREEYKTARKLQKTKLNWTIVEKIRASGGRFLERSQPSDTSRGVGWIEASDENSRDKVSKCFRTTTKRTTSKKSQQNEGADGVAALNDDGAVDGDSIIVPFQVPSAIQVDDDNFPNKKARVAI